ncbi:PWI domain containing protein [Babesia divergens]|uniref:PWI domain containing protein n=1 Tax=Babesia divergens TaxID=32595 RepID=A0AAD9G6Z1_BABDI|nr:PWI domain containing protein [Babesia divergens]
MLRGSRFSRDSGDLKSPFLAGKERELLESKKWPACFSQSVDITKVQIDAFKPWITRRVTELMGVEDEIVVDYCISQLKFFGETDAKANTENAGDGGVGLNEKPYLDPKKLQINLTGFMAKNARVFVKELWDLLIAAQDNDYGIPQAFIDEKKREIAEIQSAAKEVDSTLKEMAMKPAGESTEAFDNGGSFVGAHGDGHSKKSVEAPSCDVASLRRGSMEHRRAPRSRSRSPSTAWYKDHKYHRSKGGYRGSSHSRAKRPKEASPQVALQGLFVVLFSFSFFPLFVFLFSF